MSVPEILSQNTPHNIIQTAYITQRYVERLKTSNSMIDGCVGAGFCQPWRGHSSAGAVRVMDPLLRLLQRALGHSRRRKRGPTHPGKDWFHPGSPIRYQDVWLAGRSLGASCGACLVWMVVLGRMWGRVDRAFTSYLGTSGGRIHIVFTSHSHRVRVVFTSCFATGTGDAGGFT